MVLTDFCTAFLWKQKQKETCEQNLLFWQISHGGTVGNKSLLGVQRIVKLLNINKISDKSWYLQEEEKKKKRTFSIIFMWVYFQNLNEICPVYFLYSSELFHVAFCCEISLQPLLSKQNVGDAHRHKTKQCPTLFWWQKKKKSPLKCEMTVSLTKFCGVFGCKKEQRKWHRLKDFFHNNNNAIDYWLLS